MSPFHASLIAWGIVALIVLTVELLGWRDVVPWNTLTWTIRQTFAHYGQWAYLLFFGLLSVFAAHIVYRKSKKNEPEGRK